MSYHLGLGTGLGFLAKEVTAPVTTTTTVTTLPSNPMDLVGPKQGVLVGTRPAAGPTQTPWFVAVQAAAAALQNLVRLTQIYPSGAPATAIPIAQQFLAGQVNYGPAAISNMEAVGSARATGELPDVVIQAAKAVTSALKDFMGRVVAGLVAMPSSGDPMPAFTTPGASTDYGPPVGPATIDPALYTQGGQPSQLPSWALPAGLAVGALLLWRILK
jgi:hypothetical protein